MQQLPEQPHPETTKGAQWAPLSRSRLPQPLLHAVGDPPAVEVVRGDLDAHTVAREHADAEAAHLAGELADQLMTVVQADTEHQVGQSLGDLALELDFLFNCHRFLSIETDRAAHAAR